MPNLYVVMGYSDSGKDTLSDMMANLSPQLTVILKWSKPMKDMLEYAYGLHLGSLEDKEFRKTEVPTMPGYTWSDLMIKCYHYFPRIDPLMMVHHVTKDINTALDNEIDVIINDTRNISEKHAISHLVSQNPRVRLVTLWITSPFENKKPSDVHTDKIFKQLCEISDKSLLVDNCHNLEYLQTRASEVIRHVSN